MTTSVALILFNRPDHAARVFRRIAEARPRRLFPIADGPRAGNAEDRDLCAKARAAVSNVDWPAEVHYNFSDINLGCGRRVSSGLDWVFARTPEAIVLEDDCVPGPDFFPFCEDLLERYRCDTRIGIISGDNFVDPQVRCDSSYYFSKYAHVWGWATWRRTWQLFDFQLSAWPAVQQRGMLRSILGRPEVVEFWARIFDYQHRTQDGWAARLVFACLLNGLLNAMPAVNLVSNIGWGPGATNALNPNEPCANLPAGHLPFPLRHPAFATCWAEADDYTERHHFGVR